jgi:hypothetical protein
MLFHTDLDETVADCMYNYNDDSRSDLAHRICLLWTKND